MEKSLSKAKYIDKTSFPIVGMHCVSCARLLEKKLYAIPGVLSVAVNYGSEQATVESQKGKVNKNELRQAVEDSGYKALINVDQKAGDAKTIEDIKEEEKRKRLKDLKVKVIVSGIISIILFTGNNHNWFYFLPQLPVTSYLLLSLVVQFWAGKEFYQATWSGLKNRSAGMDTLIAMGTSAAFGFSRFLRHDSFR